MKNFEVAIIAPFYTIDRAYSLCNVVEDQIKMFTDNGYNIKVILDEGLNPSEVTGAWNQPAVMIEKIPRFSRDNDGILPSNYQEEVDKLYESLKVKLAGVKVCVTHDVILQPAHIPLNLACRRIAEEREDIRWLHWLHSASAPEVRCSDEGAKELMKKKFPNSLICYPNDWDRKRVALNYGYEIDEVKCVHHPSDFVSLLCGEEIKFEDIPGMSKESFEYLDERVNLPIRLSRDFIKEFDLLSADVISVYPCRLDRGKQVEWNIKTMAAMKRLGRSVRMVIFDFHSTGGDKVTYREELKQTALRLGLNEKECVFVSEWRNETRIHSPREMVMNLKKFADFHMHPSTSETYSLVVQESMMLRNFCILNHHCGYMADIYGTSNVLYEPMGSAMNMLQGENGATNIKIDKDELHFENIANKILYFIEKADPVLAQWRFIRKHRNLNYVFKHEFEPLLYFKNLKPLI